MTAANHDFTIEKNSDFKERLVWKDKNRRPVNLTGYTALMHIRDSKDSATPLLTLSTENGRISIGGGANGAISLQILVSDLASLPIQVGSYDLVLIGPLGVSQKRIVEGRIVIVQGSTRQA